MQDSVLSTYKGLLLCFSGFKNKSIWFQGHPGCCIKSASNMCLQLFNLNMIILYQWSTLNSQITSCEVWAVVLYFGGNAAFCVPVLFWDTNIFLYTLWFYIPASQCHDKILVSVTVFSNKRYFMTVLQHIVSGMEWLSTMFSCPWVTLVQGWWKYTSISKDLNTLTAKGHTWLTWQVIENITVIGCFTSVSSLTIFCRPLMKSYF